MELNTINQTFLQDVVVLFPYNWNNHNNRFFLSPVELKFCRVFVDQPNAQIKYVVKKPKYIIYTPFAETARRYK